MERTTREQSMTDVSILYQALTQVAEMSGRISRDTWVQIAQGRI
jgi:hypothetical protein